MKIILIINVSASLKLGPNAPIKKLDVPILIAPNTVTRPIKLSHVVTQPMPTFPRIEPQ